MPRQEDRDCAEPEPELPRPLGKQASVSDLVRNGLLACRQIYHFSFKLVLSHTLNIILRLVFHKNDQNSLVLVNKSP